MWYQYTSAEFKEFSKSWGFDHVTSSPYHQQSNGLAEKYVGIVKSLLNKSLADGKDPYIALLDYRNTPINDVNSPSQILMSRKLRTNIPATKNQLKPKCADLKTTRSKMTNNRNKQKYYYDRNAKSQNQFKEGQSVRYQESGKWKKAMITKKCDTPRSYILENEHGQSYRRNSKNIRNSNENFEFNKFDEETDDIELSKTNDIELSKQDKETATDSNHLYTTRSGRQVRPPIRFQDYVCK